MTHYFKFLESKKTTNISLIIIAVFLILFYLTVIFYVRNTANTVNNASNYVSNLIRPFSQLAHNVSNDLQSNIQNLILRKSLDNQDLEDDKNENIKKDEKKKKRKIKF